MNNSLKHIALILDGNKRWSKKNNINAISGYTKGFEKIKEIVDYSLDIQVSSITLFALSSENFNRASVSVIYEVIYKNFINLLNQLIEEKDIKINIFGSKENLPKKIQDIFDKIEDISANNKSLILNIAFNYGFKNEVKYILQKVYSGEYKINFDNENDIKELFYLGNIKDPDLLIRTGGHKRLSNFIMYNLTYTELFFTDTLWPDFSISEFKKIINDFYNIERKYGL